MFNLISILLIIIFVFLMVLFSQRAVWNTRTYSIKVDNLERRYRVHLPKNYDKNKKYPLLVVLHALGDGPLLIELNTGFSRKADDEKFIVAYPKGTGSRLSWNAQFCCDEALKNNVNDVKFLNGVIEKIKTDFSIDDKKIFMTGLSNGGMMAYKAASEIPGIRAIAVVAGTIGSKNNKIYPPAKSLPLLVIHGGKDKTVPLEGGGQFSFLSIEKSIKIWTKENPKKAVLKIVKNRGHLWFGGLQDYILNRTKPNFYATDEIWNFFKNL